MRLLLRTGFSRYSGYGNDGVDIARFLERHPDVELWIWPATMTFPGLPHDFVHLFTRHTPREDNSFDATLTFLPPFDIRITPPRATHPNRRKFGLPVELAPLHYGWSMWEKTQLTKRDMTGHSAGARPWKRLRAMYCTSDVSQQAFSFFDPKTEYRILPCGIDPSLYPIKRRDTEGPTRFCMAGELHIRKDPFVAIDAFRELKEEHGDRFDAELHLKTTIPGLHPMIEDWIPGVSITQAYWSYAELIEWYQSMHCYVGPSRGEGNLKPPMEFMATGGTVAATFWSGPTNWLTPEVGYPLEYVLRPLDPAQPNGPIEARASKDHLKEIMWHVHTNRKEASDKGYLGATWIRDVAGWKNIIDRLVNDIGRDLAALSPSKGVADEVPA